MNQTPKVTVLMSVYNSERYVREAIESILTQTFTDFEFLIINDGSTDQSREIIRSYHDPRIRLIDNERNIGLTKSLNKGIALARGEYIARMDADDISLPERFEKQTAFLEAHPEVGVLGTAFQIVGEFGEKGQISRFHKEHGFLKWLLCFFENPIAHPTVMIKRTFFRQAGEYDESMKTSQDYELWSRVAELAHLANLQEVLLLLRKHGMNISSKKFQEQKQNSLKISCSMMSKILAEKIEPVEELEGFCNFLWNTEKLHSHDRMYVVNIIYKLYLAFLRDNTLSNHEKRMIGRDAITRTRNVLDGQQYNLHVWITYFKLWMLNKIFFLRN